MARKKEVVITCNATNVKAVIEGLERGMAALAKEEEHLLNVIKQRGYAENDEKKRLKELEKAMDAMRTNVQKNKEEQKKLGEVMKDLAGSKLKDLKKALQEGKAALNNMAGNDPRRAKLVDDLKRIQQQIERNTGAMKNQGNVLATTAKNLATYMVGFAGFNKIKSLVEGVFQSNLKLSDSLADIRKVSGLAMEDINRLYRNIAQIDSRNTIETLNQLAYTGAKLGIGQNYGVEGLTGFVKAAEQVQMALGEDMGEKALPELAKMTEVMGLIEKYGVEQSMQKAASAIFQLGATSTATGTNIVEFAKRLYGLANVSRVSADDLLALGSAADAMGLMPEVAATAFNKLFTSVQKNHNMIEKTLGLQPGLIKGYYEQGKTMEAIVAIFEKMNETGNLNLLGNVFKDLGSDGARLVNVMATMSDRVDILRKHLETSRDAFKEGEAVIGEYMIQNQTAQAMMERASNLWAKAFTNPEGVDMVKQMAQAWYDLSKRMTESEGLMHSLRTSIELIALAIKSIIALSPYLIRFGVIMAGAFGIKSILMGFAALRTAFITFIADVRMASSAMGMFNAAMKSNILLGVASAVAAVATVLWDYSKAAEETAKREAERQAELKKAFESSKEAVQNVVKPLETYKKVLDQANLTEKQKMEMVKDFNNTYRDYLDYLGIEVKTVDDLRDAYARVVEVMKIKKAYEERESYRTQLNGTNRMDRIGAQAKAESEARSLGIEGINKEYLEGTQNKVKGGVRTSMGTTGVLLDLLKKRYGDNVGLSERGQVYRIETVDKSRPVSASNQRIVNIDVDISGLRDAVNDYITAYRAERQTNQEVDKMFDSEFTWTDADGKKRKLSEFDLDDYNRKVQEARWKRKGSLDNEKPDKAAIAAAKKAAQEQKQAMRKEMQDAEQNVTGIISKLEEYYRLQEAAIQEARASGDLTENQAAEMVRSLSILKNETLSTARRAVTTGDTAQWDKTKQQLQSYMADTSEVSQNLLHEIVDADVQALHTSLAKFNGTKDVYGLSAGAFFDQMNAKAAGNQREAARLRAKLQNEVEKALLQYQFVEQAQQKMQADLEKMGFVTETYEQLAARLQAGITEKPDTVLRMTSRQQQARNEMTDRFNATQGIGTAMPEDMGEWFKEFTDNGQAEWSKTLPELQKWVQDTDKYKDDIQHLYDLLKQLQRGQTIGMTDQQTQTTQTEIDRTVSTRLSDEDAFRQMGAKFMQQGVINFRYNIDNEQEAQQWVHQFATNAKGELEGWAQAFPELSRWIDLIKRQEQGETLGEAEQKALEAAMPQIRNLYNEMLNHADRVNKAMKQAFEHEKQQQDIRFQVAGYRDAEERTDASLEMRGKMQDAMGTGQNFWQQNGLADAITTDPEVMRIQNRMQYRALEYQDAQRHLEQMLALQEQEMEARREAGAEQEELDNLAIQHKQARAGFERLAHDRETALLTEFTNLSSRVSQEIADRVQTIQSLSQPIADFAENAGQKLGDMIFNMESQSMTWNQIWKQMVLALAKSTIQMGAQWLTQKIQQALFYKQMEADETLHQTIMTTIALGGAMARMQGEAAINATSLGVNAATNAAEIGQEVSLATVLTSLGISKGAAKIIGTLGWWGIPLIAVISSLLMGLLASALSTAGSESAGATSSSGSTSSATKTKLVSGMLTYDKGNVDRFDGRRKLYDDGETQVYGRKHRYVGDDGRVYTATDEPSPRTGLVTRPIATTVQGQPALVAERGPEIVIGRETTQAIMMNEPELLQHLIDIDRNRSLAGNYSAMAARAVFDEGTAPLNPPSRGTDGTATVPDASASGETDRESRLAAALEQSNAALRENAAAMLAVREQLKQPVHINMYGETGLRQSLRKADRTMSRYDG